MKKPHFSYRNVTDDAEAATRANRAPELRAGLIECGFTPIGLAEFRAPGMTSAFEALPTNPDLELMRDAVENGEVDEVMTSPDQRAFAAVENAFGGPVVSIRTLMENGRVVETTMKPTRPPQTANPFEDLSNSPIGQASFSMPFILKLTQFVVGKLPLWSRGNWPRTGYDVELAETRDVKTLWQRHQQRLAVTQRLKPSDIRPHIVLPLYMAFNCRTTEIIEHQVKWGGRISNAVFALFLLMIPLMLWMTSQLSAAFKTASKSSPLGPLLFLAPIVFMLVVAILAMILMGLAKTYLAPRLPGPKLRTASELLAEAHTHLTTEPLPKLPTIQRIRPQIPAGIDPKQTQRPIGQPSRNKMLFDRGIAGALLSTGLSSARQWAVAPVGLLDIARQIGLGLLFGGLISIWWTSGTSIKFRATTGAITGLITALILPFIPGEGLARALICALSGGVIWVAIGLLAQRLTRKASSDEKI